MSGAVRVYVPLTLRLLRRVLEAGEVGPPPLLAFAVTPALREDSGVRSAGDDPGEDDLEELEYAAMTEAARASLELLARELEVDPGTAPRRVVLAADVPDTAVARLDDGRSRAGVRVAAAVPLTRVASGHVDDEAAADDVRAAAAATSAGGAADAGSRGAAAEQAEDHELLWFATQELPDLVADPH